MEYLPDIEIARRNGLRPILDIAADAGIDESLVECYGRYKAKLCLPPDFGAGKSGKLVLVTAVTPTSAGEGKTTVTIGLADGLRRLGRSAVLALREPSLGPVFGLKGGATGGGHAQIVPMEDINLHFTGDIHAVGAANNLLAAMLDNHIRQGNALGIDISSICWKRCVDMNDRQLRCIKDGLGGKANGVPREDGFDITVASEIMAILCLASSLHDLKERLARIVVAFDTEGRPVTAADLKAVGAMAALLKDAIKPNLVQTLEGTPAIVHGGPFANIAHGCNSVIATKTALALGDYAVTEAGFGADLGAEKFFDIKCRTAGLSPAAVVLVVTVRALKMHGGVPKNALSQENVAAVVRGLPNLMRHARNIREVYGLPCVVAVNRFRTDTDEEVGAIVSACREKALSAVVATVWEDGGKGGEALAKEVVRLCEEKADFRYCYEDSLSVTEKIDAVVRRVYGGSGVVISPAAQKQIDRLTALGFAELPVCIAKTQYSFSDDPKKLGAPEDFTVSVRGVRLSAGAGFIVALTGDVLTMPGLPRVPAAEGIDVTDDGIISGLF
ncbi:MAG: formate--tetrahydrofolate ligase [Oscillospiraceae bacterium]|nr:formate--tetrahydrofolate ligase [Oscillospiraceae bacterium]MDY2910212.1 formate--tetrahydrofolate ligase [Oscillospiraceae bacterium]